MKYTKKQIKKAYLEWCTDERLNPTKYETTEDGSKEDIKDVSEGKANHLISLIEKNK